MPAFKDLTGKRFGKLTVISIHGKNKHGQYTWNCTCECGGSITVVGGDLHSGTTKSCGCIKPGKKKCQERAAHKDIHKRWLMIRARCSASSGAFYKYYSSRGISVCSEWSSFESFCKWCLENGFRKDLDIDRIDNTLGYSPSNCQFITRRDNLIKRTAIPQNNTSGVRGVAWHKNSNKWYASIFVNGEYICLGGYKDKVKATTARSEAERKHNYGVYSQNKNYQMTKGY